VEGHAGASSIPRETDHPQPLSWRPGVVGGDAALVWSALGGADAATIPNETRQPESSPAALSSYPCRWSYRLAETVLERLATTQGAGIATPVGRVQLVAAPSQLLPLAGSGRGRGTGRAMERSGGRAQRQ
jgi:hypothetical protein